MRLSKLERGVREASEADLVEKQGLLQAWYANPPAILLVYEVSKLLAVSETKVREWVRQGSLQSINVGDAVRIPREALTELRVTKPNTNSRRQKPKHKYI